jgi:hypothetical protein
VLVGGDFNLDVMNHPDLTDSSGNSLIALRFIILHSAVKKEPYPAVYVDIVAAYI